MNTLQITCFLKIVESGSFSQASKDLYISQPTISKHIRNLENELECVLFDRESNPVKLTMMGEHYHVIFTAFKTDLTKLKQLSRSVRSDYEGSIHIGILSGWKLTDNLKQGIRFFMEKYPNVDLLFENQNVKDMISKLNNHTLDACFHLYDFVSMYSNLSSEKLIDIPKYLVYLKNKSDDSGAVNITDFANEKFLCLENGASDPTKKRMLEYCAYYGFLPKITPLPNIESVISNIEFGNGVTILDSLTYFNGSESIEKIEMQPCHSVCFAWTNHCQNQLVSLLKDELVKYFKYDKSVPHISLQPPIPSMFSSDSLH